MTTNTTTTDATTQAGGAAPEISGERADLLQALATRRYFLRFTVRDLTDEQAARRTTVSRLCLGGLIKHVADVEQAWINFVMDRPGAPGGASEASVLEHENSFVMMPGETLSGLLSRYEQVARETDEIVATLPDLDLSHPLPEAPWFAPGARWSARQVFLHIIGETAQHAGHADIIREALDGGKTMG